MDLKAYLLSLDMPARLVFAEACDTSYPHVRNIAYGSKPCGEKLAIAIERESGGAVRCEDLRPDVDWAYLRGTPKPADESAGPAADRASLRGQPRPTIEPAVDPGRDEDRRAFRDVRKSWPPEEAVSAHPIPSKVA